MNLSINEAMVLQKAVKERANQLKSLRSEVAVKKMTDWFGARTESDKKETVEPQFDVKAVDKKITQLELFLFKLESQIKQKNATTYLEIEANVDELLAPLA